MMMLLDLPVWYILVSNGQCLDNDLKTQEESAKAEDNRAWIAYLALLVSRNIIVNANRLSDWSNAENTMKYHAEII